MLRNRINILKNLMDKEVMLTLSMLEKTQLALKNKDVSIITQIIEDDESTINELEIEIMKYSVSTLALFQPEAKYLRRIIASMQINNSLERVADILVNVASKIPSLISKEETPQQALLLEMLDSTADMLSDSMQAFQEKNIELAKSIFIKDDNVDELRDTVLEDTISSMKEDTIDVTLAINIINLAQHIERMADLTTNISKSTIYMISGEITEHNR